MPYKTEHAARFVDPDEFERFTRVNNKFGKGIDVIFGWNKGKSEVQALRFDATKFSPKEAKLKAKELMKKTPIIFEPAKEEMKENYLPKFKALLESIFNEEEIDNKPINPAQVNEATTNFLKTTKELLTSRGFKYSEKFIEGDHAEWMLINDKGDSVLLEGQKNDTMTYITSLYITKGETANPERMETVFNMPGKTSSDPKAGFVKDINIMSKEEFASYKKSIEESLKIFSIIGK